MTIKKKKNSEVADSSQTKLSFEHSAGDIKAKVYI